MVSFVAIDGKKWKAINSERYFVLTTIDETNEVTKSGIFTDGINENTNNKKCGSINMGSIFNDKYASYVLKYKDDKYDGYYEYSIKIYSVT